MSITDELREYADELDTAASRKSEHGFSPIAMKLTAIADRIDEHHRRALERVAAMVDEPDKRREAYYDRFISRMVDEDATTAMLYELEERVEHIERLLSHKGGAA